MCLPLSINGDVPAFDTKRRRALITCNAYYPSNQIRVTSNMRLPLTTKVVASPILHKLRRTTKTCLLFILHPRGRPALPRMWAHLALPGDDRLRARFRSMSLLFEFFYIVIVMIIMTKHCKSVTYVNPSVGQKWKSHVYKFIIYLVELTHIKRIVQFQNHLTAIYCIQVDLNPMKSLFHCSCRLN
jgi:hypothetical protein